MLQFQPFSPAKGHQCADLVLDIGPGLVSRNAHVAPAKTQKVGIRRMSAHGDAALTAQADGFLHDKRVSAVPAAGHVSRRDVRNDVSIHAQGIGGKAFSKITVQVNARHLSSAPRSIFKYK